MNKDLEIRIKEVIEDFALDTMKSASQVDLERTERKAMDYIKSVCNRYCLNFIEERGLLNYYEQRKRGR